MDFSTVKKWVVFFIGILCTIVIADFLAVAIVSALGIGGWIGFLINFVLYAVFFFGVLYAFERIFRVDYFSWRKG
jgi:hypothetical protein